MENGSIDENASLKDTDAAEKKTRKRRRRSNSPKHSSYSSGSTNTTITGCRKLDIVMAVGLFVTAISFIRSLPNFY